jgi:hypothetical protein
LIKCITKEKVDLREFLEGNPCALYQIDEIEEGRELVVLKPKVKNSKDLNTYLNCLQKTRKRVQRKKSNKRIVKAKTTISTTITTIAPVEASTVPVASVATSTTTTVGNVSNTVATVATGEVITFWKVFNKSLIV